MARFGAMTDPKPASPLSKPEPWSLVAPHYAEDVVPLFEGFAEEALRLAEVTQASRVVDVASGPGTLALLAANAGARVSALDFSPEMIQLLRTRASEAGLIGMGIRVGDGMALPFEDASFDAAFSMFGLMFFPDRARGFSELHRVLRPGGRAVVSSWQDFAKVPELAAAFGALASVLPKPEGAPPPQPPMPLSTPEACVAEMRAAGFSEVRVVEHVVTAEYESTSAWLESMARSTAPIVLLKRSLGDAWHGLLEQWRERLIEAVGPGPQRVPMPANLTLGVR